MIYDIELQDGDQITVVHYEGDPVKIQVSSIHLEAEASLLEKDVRQLISGLVCTLPDARRFIQDDRYGREWKAQAMTWKKEELVEQLQKAKVENLWLIDQIRMRSQWDWEDGGLEGGLG